MRLEKIYSVTTATPLVLNIRELFDVWGNRDVPEIIGVRMIPGASGTLLAETSRTPGAGTTGVTATWVARAGGAVSATTDDDVTGPITALRFTAATSTGTVEIVA